jgi:hypothetical protein
VVFVEISIILSQREVFSSNISIAVLQISSLFF